MIIVTVTALVVFRKTPTKIVSTCFLIFTSLFPIIVLDSLQVPRMIGVFHNSVGVFTASALLFTFAFLPVEMNNVDVTVNVAGYSLKQNMAAVMIIALLSSLPFIVKNLIQVPFSNQALFLVFSTAQLGKST